MAQYFAADYSGGPFVILSPPHVAALAAVLLLNLALSRFRGADENRRRYVRWTLACALWGAEISWHVWNLAVGTWAVQTMLPLNICSLLIWLSAIMLIRQDRTIYEFAYFLGIGGALQYLATPDLGIYGFPHFRFFQTFLSHGLLLTAPVYMTVAEGFRPTWTSLIRVTAWTNIYMVAVYLFNTFIGSNYLMLNAKPVTPSLLDLLPQWPDYIVYMELIGIVTLLCLYLPFFVDDRRAAKET